MGTERAARGTDRAARRASGSLACVEAAGAWGAVGGGAAGGGVHDETGDRTDFRANGSNAKPMAPTAAESSEKALDRKDLDNTSVLDNATSFWSLSDGSVSPSSRGQSHLERTGYGRDEPASGRGSHLQTGYELEVRNLSGLGRGEPASERGGMPAGREERTGVGSTLTPGPFKSSVYLYLSIYLCIHIYIFIYLSIYLYVFLCTLYPEPYNLQPMPAGREERTGVGSTPNPGPQTPNPTSHTPNLKPQTPNPTPPTPNLKHQTPDSKPKTLKPKPYTPNPKP